MELMKYLRTDEELCNLRKEWKEKTSKAFPPFNTDEYKGIKDYKDKIKEKLQAL